jgi:hypothetical protein
MRKLRYSAELVAKLAELTTRIMESPIQFMSADEMERGPKLSEPEFIARAKAYIKDPETNVPGWPEDQSYTIGLLAKLHSKGIETNVVKKYMLVVPPPPGYKTHPAKAPLKPAAKKRKVEQLKKTLAKHKKP